LKPSSATFSNDPFDDAGKGRSIAVTIALGLIRAYQLVLSPIFAGSCRFVPSCSEYAAEAVRRHGVFSGSWLAARRLARCHPFCEGGHDPVPARATAGKPMSATAAVDKSRSSL
jgi:uncharacterized protein